MENEEQNEMSGMQKQPKEQQNQVHRENIMEEEYIEHDKKTPSKGTLYIF